MAENLLLPFSFKNNSHLRRPHFEELTKQLREVHLQDLGMNDHAMNLSVGQLQRLCLVRGLLLAPEVLLLDEPTSALDPESARAVMMLLERLNAASRMTVLVVTHKTHDPERITPRYLQVADGQIKEYT